MLEVRLYIVLVRNYTKELNKLSKSGLRVATTHSRHSTSLRVLSRLLQSLSSSFVNAHFACIGSDTNSYASLLNV